MGRKPKIVTTVDENDLELFKKQYLNAGDLQKEIDALEDEESKIDKRTKEYQQWKNRINFLMDMYNVKIGTKVYAKKV